MMLQKCTYMGAEAAALGENSHFDRQLRVADRHPEVLDEDSQKPQRRTYRPVYSIGLWTNGNY